MCQEENEQHPTSLLPVWVRADEPENGKGPSPEKCTPKSSRTDGGALV